MTTALAIFLVTYLVIGLQRIPKLHIGRPAGALLGATAMVAFGVLSFDDAKSAIDLDTIFFLLGMMIVLGYLELSGFFELVERRIIGAARTPRALLVLVVLSAGVLSAVFMNDTICLMLTPIVLRVARRLDLPPVPYLIALATASNVGSACTIVGNPQNALIGVRSGIPLLSFAGALWPVSAAGLAVCAGLVAWIYRREAPATPLTVPPPLTPPQVQPWLLASGLLSGLGLVVALSLGANPGAAAMTAAAAVILAGATRPRLALGTVDWSLILLFGGLFVVMRAVDEAGLARFALEWIAGPLHEAGAAAQARLALSVTVLSQAVSNVPTVMLFLPALHAAPVEAARPLWLALAAYSTLAGNLTIIGSVANLIVFESAQREGVRVGFFEYLRVGLPLTGATLFMAWAWLTLWR